MTALVDPVVPTKDLISLREIARCFHGGMLTEGEAATAISRLSPEFVGAFTDTATAAAVIDMIDAILQARSPAAPRLSRSQQYRVKAAECLHFADNANTGSERIYKNLADGYEQLALQAEGFEELRYRQLASRTEMKR